jgi:hypothetical protein
VPTLSGISGKPRSLSSAPTRDIEATPTIRKHGDQPARSIGPEGLGHPAALLAHPSRATRVNAHGMLSAGCLLAVKDRDPDSRPDLSTHVATGRSLRQATLSSGDTSGLVFASAACEPMDDAALSARKLLIVTALVETAAGLTLLFSPPLVAALLLGASLDAPAAGWRAMTGRAAPYAGWSRRCCCITALRSRFSRTLPQVSGSSAFSCGQRLLSTQYSPSGASRQYYKPGITRSRSRVSQAPRRLAATKDAIAPNIRGISVRKYVVANRASSTRPASVTAIAVATATFLVANSVANVKRSCGDAVVTRPRSQPETKDTAMNIAASGTVLWRPFRNGTGSLATINKVLYDVADDVYVDLERELAAAMARD